MPGYIRFAAAVLAGLHVAFVWAPTAWSADKATPASTTPPSAQNVVANIEKYLASLQQQPQQPFMGSVLVSRGGKAIFEKSYGLANAEWNIPNSPATKFRLGSITKQFTAVLVMQLQEQGKLKVTDPLCKYVEPCPAAWAPVTLHHLLSHTAGMPSYTEDAGYRTGSLTPQKPEEIVARFRDKPLEFAPGSQFKYSNSGYFLLGMVIEKAAGKPYEAALTEQIFKPLGMQDSGYDRTARVLANRASGYRFAANRVDLENADYVDLSWPYSAGALYSTVRDMQKWDDALYTDKVLPQAALAKMWTPVLQGYGYGWVMSAPPASPHRTISHGGSINGFSTFFARYPDDKLAVVVLSNNVMGQTEAVARRVATLAFGETLVLPEDRKAIALSPEALGQFVGQYRLNPQFIISVRVDGDHLSAQATGQPPLAFFHESEASFFARGPDAQLTFQKDAGGKVTGVVLHQNGNTPSGPRISDTVVERKEVPVAPTVLERYVGEYELAPGFTIQISRESDHLMAQATGQSKVPLFPESETDFFYKVVDAQITFQVDAAGKATGLVLHQVVDRPAKKIR